MDKSIDLTDKYKDDSALYYMTAGVTFKTYAAPHLSLFRIQTLEGVNNRDLGGADLYNIHFGVVFDEATTTLSVQTKTN